MGACMQIYAGKVTELQTGVNTLGGTPIKPNAERERRGDDQLRDDMETMSPPVTPEVWIYNLPAAALLSLGAVAAVAL